MRPKHLARLLALAVLLCFVLILTAQAQNYVFSLDKEVVDLWIQSDGSVILEYDLTFRCHVSADPIDVIDLGLPTGDYQISNIRADVDDKPVSRIDTDYQGEGDHGVAIWLGSAEIKAGETGTVHIVVEGLGGMLYQDSDDPNYASLQFSPVWFSSDFTVGDTDLTVHFHLPPGTQPDEPRWHRSPDDWPEESPRRSLDGEGRPTYSWHNPQALPYRSYVFGASFPSQYVDEGAIQKGPSVWGKIASGIAGVLCNPITIFILIIMAIAWFSNRAQKRRRMAYLPPSMKVEGVGIKRGLTAVEAAILLETPLNKVLTMILFGLLKKGAITVLENNPLKIQLNEPLPEKLRAYEQDFVAAVKEDGTLKESKLRDMMIDLVKAVNNRMKGFSRKESETYYRDIVRRAWQQVEGAETPEVRGQLFGEGLEWTLLDDGFEDRTRDVFAEGPVFLPNWWMFYRPWSSALPAGTSAPSTSTAAPSLPSGPVQLPTLPGADFAASIVDGVQTTAGRIVSSITDFTGGVTKVTNPPPKPSSTSSSSSRSRGGGSGCACACACACAGCACACAGGGR
ncbi:MAG: hypothetical protein JXA37_14680 [Chloroflexia bacterium]|nr:hypothetical protein [Chloroflexia bacterium]